MDLMKGLRVDRCPGCGGDHGVVDGPAGVGFATSAGGRSYWQPSYEVRRCSACGLVYKSAVASPTDLADYYSRVDYRKWVIHGLFPTERLVLRHLRKVREGSRVLDLGCSVGRLLSKIVSTHQCYGVELNSDAASEAASAGLTMLDPSGWMRPDSQLEFDTIVLVDVFEHLADPLKFLTAAVNRLAITGNLIICTGDADAPAVCGDLANFWYMRNIEHLIMLTRKYADHLADRLGLRLTRWERVSHYDSTPLQRFGQWYRSTVFDAMYRGKRSVLAPMFRRLPGGRKAATWTDRPTRNLTADHVVVMFERRKESA